MSPLIVPEAKGNQKFSLKSPTIKGINPDKRICLPLSPALLCELHATMLFPFHFLEENQNNDKQVRPIFQNYLLGRAGVCGLNVYLILERSGSHPF